VRGFACEHLSTHDHWNVAARQEAHRPYRRLDGQAELVLVPLAAVHGRGAGCANIDNAVQRTYLLTPADVDHTVRVAVTASNQDGQASASSQTSDVVSATTAPRNTSAPTISGTAQVGEELTATRGTWTGGVRSYSYQWQRCDVTGEGCADVTGAAGTSYGVRGADVGHTLRVTVTATNLAGPTSTAARAPPSVRRLRRLRLRRSRRRERTVVRRS
jgi:hypothetical protein